MPKPPIPDTTSQIWIQMMTVNSLRRVPLHNVWQQLKWLVCPPCCYHQPPKSPVLEAIRALGQTQTLHLGDVMLHTSFVPITMPHPTATVLAMRVEDVVHPAFRITILPAESDQDGVQVSLDPAAQQDPIVMAAVLRALEGDQDDSPQCHIVLPPPESKAEVQGIQAKTAAAHTGAMTPMLQLF